jgi:glyoxylase-like metal-dependent hydrolase (beta-lactamase superfamily II)
VSAPNTPGIHAIPVPTPFAVGRVNCYLIDDAPLTLIDTGPNSGTSLHALERGLRALGVQVEDLELIVLTHHHPDHIGLVRVLTERSGAEVAAFAPMADWLSDYASAAREDDEYVQAMLRHHGVDTDVVSALAVAGASFRAFGSGAAVTRPLRDGDLLALRDRRFRVRHRPGHSTADLIFVQEDGPSEGDRVTIAGDHLLPHISSNPLITRPFGAGAHLADPRPTPLVDYIASLTATRELAPQWFLPGHGDPFTDHVAVIDERLRLHERRAGKVRSLLAGGPQTAHELALAMWGKLALGQALLTLSEVLGHVDLLLARGEVVELPGDPARFALA